MNSSPLTSCLERPNFCQASWELDNAKSFGLEMLLKPCACASLHGMANFCTNEIYHTHPHTQNLWNSKWKTRELEKLLQKQGELYKLSPLPHNLPGFMKD